MMTQIIQENGLRHCQYAEPFAGGAGLALALLYESHVGDIHINDLDKTIWSFWHTAINETEFLIEKINKCPLNIEEWRTQKEIYNSAESHPTREVGFATFFLNRTNVSGVIKTGGPIGGFSQSGRYKIDCRFNRTELASRIKRLSKYRQRIHLYNMDALEFIDYFETSTNRRRLIYSDPPYYRQGASLYKNAYTHNDHVALRDRMTALTIKWLQTYDDTPEIRSVYSDWPLAILKIPYSLNRKRQGGEILVKQAGLVLPATTLE